MGKPVTFNLLLLRAFISIVGISIVAIVFNRLSPNGIPIRTAYKEITIQGHTDKIPVFQNRQQISQKPVASEYHAPDIIDLKTAYRYYTDYSAIFIDTRPAEDYREGHIARAVSLPLESVSFDDKLLPGLPRTETIITYCDGEECSQSIDLAVMLSELGFGDIYFFYGGWHEWQTAGYPISRGERP